MSETQLREAFALMKSGNKTEAARLVQEVLREDRSNLNAWWLFSHVIDDEEKIVKSLEKVLALNPDHLGARKKLASMRPEYAHLAATPSPQKEKLKEADSTYWKKLDASGKVKPSQVSTGIASMLWHSMGLRLKLFFIMLPFLIAYGIYFNFNNQQSFHDKNGDTPLTIAQLYLEALYRDDFETLYAMSCPAYYPEIEAMEDDASNYQPSEISVDMSETEFRVFYQNGDRAFVAVEGVTVVTYPASNFRIDWDEDADSENIDVYGQHLEKSTDGVWQICVEFYVPNLEMHEDN